MARTWGDRETKQPGVLFVTPGCGKLPEARRPMSHTQRIRILFAAQSGTSLIPAGLKIKFQASFKVGTHRLRCEHIRRVGERFRLLGLSDLARALRAGELPDETVVVTFDDGQSLTTSITLP